MEKTLKILFLLSIPIFLYGTILLLPTFDGWSYITKPYFGGLLDADRVLPTGSYWRPFDAMIGYIVGLNYHLYPLLNHIVIFTGHLINTYLVYRLSHRNIIAALFFYTSAAMLGTVLDIDSANQVYSQMWGLIATACYLQDKKILWIVSVVIATLCKENGIVFSIIPLLLVWGREDGIRIEKKLVKDGLVIGFVIVSYGFARLLLTPSGAGVNGEYLSNGIADHLKDLVQLLSYTFLPIDYVAVVYPPTRNPVLGIMTLVLSLTFLVLMMGKVWKRRKDKYFWTLVLCCFIAASPHLATLVSIMHCYSSLAIASLLVGSLFCSGTRLVNIAFCMYLTAATITGIHHWREAYRSGLIGRQMARDLLAQEKTHPQKVYLIEVDDNEQKYSMFCVIPRDAFGWGRAVCHESGYQEANEIKDTLIGPYPSEPIKQQAVNYIKDSIMSTGNYDAIWFTEDKTVSVLSEKVR